MNTKLKANAGYFLLFRIHDLKIRHLIKGISLGRFVLLPLRRAQGKKYEPDIIKE